MRNENNFIKILIFLTNFIKGKIMKNKSKIFVFLIIISILLSVSAVSASEIQADTINMDNDYQSNMELNQDLDCEPISDISTDDSNQGSDLDSNLKSDENEYIINQQSEPKDINTLEIDDESCFTALSGEINQSEEELIKRNKIKN